jgi:surfeit locus 1 family protein
MKRFFAIALILGAFVTLLGLGTWQMQRLAWKEGLIAEAETRPSLPAVPLPELIDQGTEDLAYRRAQLVGGFTGEPVRVFTTLSDPNGPYEGPGYWLMQPFVLAASGYDRLRQSWVHSVRPVARRIRASGAQGHRAI